MLGSVLQPSIRLFFLINIESSHMEDHPGFDLGVHADNRRRGFATTAPLGCSAAEIETH